MVETSAMPFENLIASRMPLRTARTMPCIAIVIPVIPTTAPASFSILSPMAPIFDVAFWIDAPIRSNAVLAASVSFLTLRPSRPRDLVAWSINITFQVTTCCASAAKVYRPPPRDCERLARSASRCSCSARIPSQWLRSASIRSTHAKNERVWSSHAPPEGRTFRRS